MSGGDLPSDPLRLHTLAKSGNVRAQVAMADVFDGEGRHDIALAWLRQAVSGGSLQAGVILGSRLLVGRAAPQDPAQGAAHIYAAADRGDAEAALRAAVLYLRGLGRSVDPDRAIDLLLAAALKGWPEARGQLAVLAGDDSLADLVRRGGAISDNRLRKARRGVDIAAWLRPPAFTSVSEEPRVRVYQDFIPPLACEWVREKASQHLSKLSVYDANAGVLGGQEIRTGRGTGFGLLDMDVVLTLIASRTAVATGLQLDVFEPPNVLTYQDGQQYRPHYDYLDPEAPALAADLALHGQRVATFLTYLNDDYEGGETAFPRLNWRFKAEAGDGLLFFNVGEDGRPNRGSLHAGLPPSSGMKWLLSQWIRDRPQPLI